MYFYVEYINDEIVAATAAEEEGKLRECAAAVENVQIWWFCNYEQWTWAHDTVTS